MMKTFVTLALLTTSVASYAQMSEQEKNRAQQKLEGTLPEPKAIESKDEYRIHMGLTAGMSNPNGAVESSPEYGINVGFQPYVPFGVGAEVTTTELDDSDVNRTNLLVRGTYNFGGDVPVLRNSYIGALTGPMFQSKGGDTEWSVGPTAGFDIPLQDKTHDFLSLGLTAKYLWTTDVQDSFSAGLALKYWY